MSSFGRGVAFLIIALIYSQKMKETWIQFLPQSEGSSALLALRLSLYNWYWEKVINSVVEAVPCPPPPPLRLGFWNTGWLWELENNKKSWLGCSTLYFNFSRYFVHTKWNNFNMRIESPHCKLYNHVALGDIVPKIIGSCGKQIITPPSLLRYGKCIPW